MFVFKKKSTFDPHEDLSLFYHLRFRPDATLCFDVTESKKMGSNETKTDPCLKEIFPFDKVKYF